MAWEGGNRVQGGEKGHLDEHATNWTAQCGKCDYVE